MSRKVINVVLSDKKNPIILGDFQGEVVNGQILDITLPLEEEKQNIINNNNDIQINITFTYMEKYISGICKIKKVADMGSNNFQFTGTMFFQLNEKEVTIPILAYYISRNLTLVFTLA